MDIHEDTHSALKSLVHRVPNVEEVVFIGYGGKMLVGDLRLLKSRWRVGEFKLLLRDMSIDASVPDEIPNDNERIGFRRQECVMNLKELREAKDSVACDQIVVRYYRGLCCVRALLVKESEEKGYSAGFLSIYTRDGANSARDFAAKKSPALLLSADHPYQKILLDSIVSWFQFIWDEGSHRL